MRKASYVVLDIETTGLSPLSHGMTELYAARVDGFGRVRDDLHTMVDPGHPIPSFITRLTGITDEMVQGAPPAAKAVRRFDSFLQDDDILVGHNLRFDRSFLDHERTRVLKSPFPHPSLCTLLLARRVFTPEPLPSYRLGSLADSLAVRVEGAHRAKADVLTTIKVQQELFKRLESVDVCGLGQAMALQRTPLPVAARMMRRP
jgi:DNA polymerase III epsilon subunit-like protein